MKHKRPIHGTFMTLLALSAACVSAEPQTGFTLEAKRQILSTFEYPIDRWTAGGNATRYVYLHMTEFWRHAIIRRNGDINALANMHREDVSNFVTRSTYGELPLQAYVRQSPTDGLIVLHEGQIVFEAYPRMARGDHHSHFSISKTFVSTLIGILEERKLLDVTKPIDFYLDELKGSAWQDISILDILDMASGIDCRESEDNSYTDPATCFYQFFEAIGFPYADQAWEAPLDFFKKMSTFRPAGEAFDYSGINTVLLSFLVEKVTQTPFAKVIEEEIWQKIGAESDAYIATSPYGHAASLGGMSSTLRDLARYGLLFIPAGRQEVQPVISSTHLDAIQNGGRPELFARSTTELLNGEAARHNTYQWDRVMSDGDFFKFGFGGQGLYISPKRDLVIAFFGSQDESGKTNELHHIARQLAVSDLFKNASSPSVR